ncbi:Oidioi.mRNA.OKI2018_I69.PAR.g10870.t1.cds [Oikopleura dioica]|uniref:Vacuolar protein sorting-associated protein 53 homolog n=1 Tax=Oikopleura dioica TaxID=34765 RepID=A0ABN7RSS9_OIKDI|nr:Oidioi.mRNA.OKI2018_I69.PAR.g10870.t1.cds [Oikopleura dioica]
MSETENPAVVEALAKMFPSDDPLDSVDFDVTQYINAMFPNEQSLSNLDEVILELSERIEHHEGEVSNLIREGHQDGKQSAQMLDEAQVDLQKLVSSIMEIKTRAEESERMVSEITRDIRQLDQAKRNLTASITTLNHLHIVLDGVENLEKATTARDYGLVATLLPGVSNVIEHLDVYKDSVEEIQIVTQRMAKIRTDLSTFVTKDFSQAFAISSKEKLDIQNVKSACQVADCLDVTVRNEVISSFIVSRLSEYKLLFDSSQEVAWFDKIDRRFAWAKKALMDVEGRFGEIFPASWEISERVAVAFCKLTVEMMSSVLEQRHHELDVKLLLFAIQRSRMFEEQLAKRYSGITITGNQTKPEHEGPKESTNPFENDFGSESGSQSELSETKLDEKLAKKESPFSRMVTCAFSNYLSIYVNAQDRSLKELVQRFVTDFAIESSQTCEVLPSCADLFVYYKKCLVQCSQLSTGEPLLNLSKIFAAHLRNYGNNVLMNNLPINTKTTNAAQSALSQMTALLKEESATRLTRHDLALTCLLLNSADYCIDTISALEDKLIEKASPEFKERIDFSPEKDLFSDVIKTSIGLLVQDTEGACGPAFQALLKTNWAAFHNVADQSAYVTAILKHLEEQIPYIRDLLANARKYFTQFCIKFASSFIGRFTSTLFKCKPISTIPAQQLLIDTQVLHSALLNLPSIGSSITRKPPLSYTKTVSSKMCHAENILKVAMNDHNDPTQFIQNFKTLLPDGDADTFKRIIDMKDLRRSEATSLLEKYRGNVTTAEDTEQYSLRKLERLIKNRL